MVRESKERVSGALPGRWRCVNRSANEDDHKIGEDPEGDEEYAGETRDEKTYVFHGGADNSGESTANKAKGVEAAPPYDFFPVLKDCCLQLDRGNKYLAEAWRAHSTYSPMKRDIVYDIYTDQRMRRQDAEVMSEF